MRVADYVMSFLASKNVDCIFTVTGGGAIFLCDALGLDKNIKYVACHHEQAASIAAEAYARIKCDLGVALVTSGPGGTNAITGTVGCWLDHVPQLTISGQVFSGQTILNHPGLRTKGVQEINIVDIVKPITKYAVMVTDASSIRYHLEKALYLAKTGRPGPVWIDIPADIQNKNIDPAKLNGFTPDKQEIEKNELTRLVNQIALLLKGAKRPLIHIGQGIRISGAEKKLLKMIDSFQMPFVTAMNGLDLIDYNHPLNIGYPGTFAQRGANFAVQTCDFYLAIGTRLSLAQTGYNAQDYARNAHVIMVDIDQAELDKDTVPIDIKVCSDAGRFLDAFNEKLHITDFLNPHWKNWVNQCQEWKLRYPVAKKEYFEIKDSVNSYVFLDMLSNELTSEDIVVTDMGFAFQNTYQAFKVKSGQRVISNSGLAPMGWGLPAAVGAFFAQKKKGRIICISGEGGLMMNIQELSTIMHHQIPVKLFIFNNGGYLTIKQTQELGFESRLMGSTKESGIDFPDFLKLADAHSLEAIRICNHKELSKKLSDIVSNPNAVVCELMMDPDQVQAPKSINRRNVDGTISQTALEDSFPFLDQSEIDENLSIINDKI
jgi:acetolactate synthase-1/2/3 large subunit